MNAPDDQSALEGLHRELIEYVAALRVRRRGVRNKDEWAAVRREVAREALEASTALSEEALS